MSEQDWEDKLAEVQKHSEHWYNKYKELENKIADLEKENTDLRDNYDQFKAIAEPEIERLQNGNAELEKQVKELAKDLAIHCQDTQKVIDEYEKENAELDDEVRKLKLLVSSLVYEINQIWDINEMNDDLRMCAEKIDREVQLSKMAEDNRMVISALGFAVVPPKPELYVKEI